MSGASPPGVDSEPVAPAETELEAAPVIRSDGLRLTVALPAFDGPLDLLLHLIRREELDIFDIPIARLTTAYLQTLALLERLEIEVASDFLVMAATLLQIKSRLLLPRPVSTEPIEVEAPDPREALVRQLLAYQQCRAVADDLDARPRVGRDTFLRPAGLERPAADLDDPLAHHDVYRLAEAFRRLASQQRFEAPHAVQVERISIGERIAQIAEALAETPRLSFDALCALARHREELITTFLAVLEMARLRLVRVEQDDRLGVVFVEARVGAIGPAGEEAAGMLGEA